MTENRAERECQTIYIAGPMRGIEYFNFPAFDALQERLEEHGWTVISPANLDRAVGFDPIEYFGEEFDPYDEGGPSFEDFWKDLPENSSFNLDECMKRDIEEIMKADAICMLPGWEKSTGATSEYFLAVWRGIPVLKAEDLSPITLDQTFVVYRDASKIEKAAISEKDPLLEAIEITGGERNEHYGPPGDNHTRTAGLWTHYKGVKFNAREVCVMNVLQKISRDAHCPKRDNLVDIAGFTRNIWMVEEGLG